MHNSRWPRIWRQPSHRKTSAVSEIALTTSGLTKRYGRMTAVDGVSISVRRGEIYGFLGPNGAGKTTTLRMVLGLVRPTSGTADVLGRAPGDPAALARIGAMVETPAFYPYLSAQDNLDVLARHAGVPKERVGEVLKTAGLASRAHDKFASYSLGMKQRLGVAGALLKDPELLILDEPTNGLDPLGMADMTALITSLGEAGKAVILSSHNLAEVQEICQRVGVIFKGKLVTQSTVEELRGSAVLVITASPLERAEMQLVELLGREKVSVEHGHIRVDVDGHEGASINRQLILAGVDVHEMRREERSLEEAFMAMSAEYSGTSGAGSAR
jgi:ABC-type multidrug transport system ATPase subunit